MLRRNRNAEAKKAREHARQAAADLAAAREAEEAELAAAGAEAEAADGRDFHTGAPVAVEPPPTRMPTRREVQRQKLERLERQLEDRQERLKHADASRRATAERNLAKLEAEYNRLFALVNPPVVGSPFGSDPNPPPDPFAPIRCANAGFPIYCDEELPDKATAFRNVGYCDRCLFEKTHAATLYPNGREPD